REELERDRAVSVSHGRTPGFPFRQGDGFAFGRSILPKDDAADPELATLALWIDVGSRDDSVGREARALALALIDEFMVRADGVQAAVGRADWAPGMTLDMTAYETACGVRGQCTLARSWGTRFLRYVTDDALWLGPDLVARIGDVEALRALAEIVPVGRC